MNTTRFQVFGLRGIDERWMTDGQDALNIEDMYITENDSWKSSGGFIQLFMPKTVYATNVNTGSKATLVRSGTEYSFTSLGSSLSSSRLSSETYDFFGGSASIPPTLASHAGSGSRPPSFPPAPYGTFSVSGVGGSETEDGTYEESVFEDDLTDVTGDDILWDPDSELTGAFAFPPTERADTDSDGQLDYVDFNDNIAGSGGAIAFPDTRNRNEYESGLDSTFNVDTFYGTTEETRRGYGPPSYESGGGDSTTVSSAEFYTPTVFYADGQSDYKEIYYGQLGSTGISFWQLDERGSPIPRLFSGYGDDVISGPTSIIGGESGTEVVSVPATRTYWGFVDVPYPPGSAGFGASYRVNLYTDLLPYGPNHMVAYWANRRAFYEYARFPPRLYMGWTYNEDPFFRYMLTGGFWEEVIPGEGGGGGGSGGSGGGSDGGSDGVELPSAGDVGGGPDVFDPYDGIYDDAGGAFGSDDSDAPDTFAYPNSTYEHYRFSSINSIHWFAQHNGARQFLIYETRNGTIVDGKMTPTNQCHLKVFDGSKYKPTSEGYASSATPEKTLRQYSDPYTGPFDYGRISEIRRRTASEISIRSQSQAYGGRLYIANGFDETIVFNGDMVEKAGFVEKPPSPSVKSTGPSASMTIPVAIGDATSDFTIDAWDDDKFPKSKAFYGKHFEVPYFGLGVASDAEIGVGQYRVRKNDAVDVYRPTDVYFTHDIQRRIHYYNNPQFDTRKCGYQYKISYVNERGQESSVSDASTVAIMHNGSNSSKNRCFHGKGAVAVDIPLGPKECVARRIYRTRNLYDVSGNLFTTGDQQSYYFLAEVQDNMTKVFMDARPDTSLGELLDTRELGNFPNRTKFLAVFKNTMFCAGSELNEVRFSSPLMPETFPEENVINIGDDDGGQIMGMRATKNALVVFKQRGIYLVKGDPSTGFASFTLNKDVGCSAPDTISELPGLGLAFLSQKSIYLLEGALENTGSPTGLQEIGIEISQTLERLNQSASIRASGCVYQKDKEYWLSIPTNGSEKNNLCLIYHYEYGAWSIRKDFPIDCMVLTKDHRGYLMMGSNDVVNENRSGILAYSRGSINKGATTLTRATSWSPTPGGYAPTKLQFHPTKSTYQTVNVDYQSVFTTFRPAHVFVYSVGYGDNELLLNTTVNRSMFLTRSFDQESDQQDPNERYPVYSEAIFEKDIWTSYRPIVNRFDVSTSKEGPVRELSVTFSAKDGHKIEIIGYDLEAKIGEQRNIKPLNAALRASRR